MNLLIRTLDGRNKQLPIVQAKKWSELDKIALEKVWSSQTIHSYIRKKRRWYVFQWNAVHRMHYRFTFTDTHAIFEYYLTADTGNNDIST